MLNQTYKNFNLIIPDNASTDDTESICREYQKKRS
ncbi:MAG: glycosyltransferase family 2 protein [Candidatus Lokiarchaeota archaeon]|nr:glycosyltransferase family 2 protein [Candidatus Lokiarchaeota archaeon]